MVSDCKLFSHVDLVHKQIVDMETKEDSHLNNDANDDSEDGIHLTGKLLQILLLMSCYLHSAYQIDQQSGVPIEDNSTKQEVSSSSEGHEQAKRDLKYGTRHALVMEDFQPSMTTSGLENLLEKFNYHDVVIRWINDTTALAIFRTPAIALEACQSIKCPFTVRVLEENDVLASSIPERDLEPPRQRPKTSARTAQRLIAHGMGIKLTSTSFGQKELKEQEEARRQRIISRQNLKDDAWGD
ncbi:nucleotide-binding alpha-beta plait domain-containing protein [Artemisia annua]|uniref:Nucleotide-binding alpha-beta plait domain-containing protein n=1 Tax=Artemisia annua TaxID=35608 RepID=A0A2U1PDV3_ARTAN|nr:nucleotide-binding alpha-beta plait domain-containing protein [Artemisia annua]